MCNSTVYPFANWLLSSSTPPSSGLSHRPLDVCNVYNSRQVKLLVHEKEKLEYPEFEDVFRDDDEDDDENDDMDDGESGGDRLARMEARVAKRQAKRNWEQNKVKILFEYEQFSFTGLLRLMIRSYRGVKIEVRTETLKTGFFTKFGGCGWDNVNFEGD